MFIVAKKKENKISVLFTSIIGGAFAGFLVGSVSLLFVIIFLALLIPEFEGSKGFVVRYFIFCMILGSFFMVRHELKKRSN